MAAKILSKYKQQIEYLQLIPGSGGCYELTLDGRLVYSKLQVGAFPEEDQMVELVGKALAKK